MYMYCICNYCYTQTRILVCNTRTHNCNTVCILFFVLKVLMTAYNCNKLVLTLIMCISPGRCSKFITRTLFGGNGRRVLGQRGSRVVHSTISLHVSVKILECFPLLQCCHLSAPLTHPHDSINKPRLLQVKRFHQREERILNSLSTHASTCRQWAIAPRGRTHQSGSGMCPLSVIWIICSLMPKCSTRTCPSGA